MWRQVGNIKGRDGQDAPPVDISVIVREAITQIPAPKDGKDGTSVSIETVREIIAAEVRQAIAAIPRPKDGKDAEPIHHDTLSLMVIEEVRKQVATIPKPDNGKDGRDALQLDILPAIDPDKNYPRGIYALHQGGLVRRTFDSWEVIVRGIAGVQILQGDDPRDISIECVLTGGEKSCARFYVPVPIFQGVWREGITWKKADTVQRDGSTWYCNVEGTKAAPGAPNSNDWTLSNKRGNHGKDGKDGVGKEGPQGKPGRDGRDLTQVDYSTGLKH